MLNGIGSSKKVSKDHIAEFRFGPYSKARRYINHLNNLYELQLDKCAYDQSLINNDLFKKQTPVNSARKLSLLPTTPVADDVLHKIRLINIFQNLSETKIKKSSTKIKNITPSKRKSHTKYFESRKYSDLLLRLKNTKGFKEDFDSRLHGLNTNRLLTDQTSGVFLTDQNTVKTARQFDKEQQQISNQLNISEKIMEKTTNFGASFFTSEQLFSPKFQSPGYSTPADSTSLSIFKFPSLKKSTHQNRKK